MGLEAEYAWLHDDLHRVVPELMSSIDLTERMPAHAGILARWIDRGGHPVPSTLWVPEPYRAELDGRWQDAADDWHERDMPFDEALALIELDGSGPAQAREIAVRLGARPLIDLIDRRSAGIG